MKLEYFADTDTLYIGLKDGAAHEVVDVGTDTLVDLDDNGIPMGITLEHAGARFDVSALDARALPEVRRRAL